MLDYSKLTWDELLKKTKDWFNNPKAITEALKRLKNNPVDSRPYKVYTAQMLGYPLFSDSVKVNVLENTLGGDIMWTKINGFISKGVLPYEVDVKKVYLYIKSVSQVDDGSDLQCFNSVYMTNNNTVTIQSYLNGNTASYFPETFPEIGSAVIEIRVYN